MRGTLRAVAPSLASCTVAASPPVVELPVALHVDTIQSFFFFPSDGVFLLSMLQDRSVRDTEFQPIQRKVN